MKTLAFSSPNKWDSHIISIICVAVLHSGVAYWITKPKQELKIEPQILKIQMIAAPAVKTVTPAIEKPQQSIVTPQPKSQIQKPSPAKKFIAPQTKKLLAQRGLVKPKELIKKPVLSHVQKNVSKILPQKLQATASEQPKQFNQFTSNRNNTSPSKITANKPSTGQNTITKPTVAAYLHNPAPHYPDIARRRKQEGIVILNVLVSPSGAAKQVSIYKSSGFSMLDESATHTVRSWKFIPAKQGNTTLEMSVKVPIKFKLR